MSDSLAMRIFPRRSLAPSLILSTMLLTLALLAWLQYRWSGQVSEAVEQRMHASLGASAQRFQVVFQEDLSRICDAFEVGTAGSDARMKSAVRDLAREWKQGEPLKELVSHVYVVLTDAEGNWRLEILDPGSGRYAPTPWPEPWKALQEDLSTHAEYLELAPPRQWHRRPWIMDPSGPVLFWAVAVESPGADIYNPLQYHLLGYVVLELNRAYLEGQYFSRLAQRYFRGSGEPDYRVAVLGTGERPMTLYDSHPSAGPLKPASADALVDLLPPSGLGWRRSGTVNIRSTGDAAALQLVAQHRKGSLDAAVARLRRRNLAVIFGVLLVLCAGTVFLVIYARRAQELARLQVDFVASVSHELRTPVAAVCMMADNLSDGIAGTEQQVRQYGRLLQLQGRRLRAMVEEILFFAAHQVQRPKLDLRPTNIAQVVACALSEQQPLIEAAGIEVDAQLPPDLPMVLADSAALQTCVKNLLDNAVRHGKDGKWIGVSGEVERGERSEVRVSVQDRGPGIPAGEQRRVFEPFYRGAQARDAQVAGTGLGLSQVRQMIEAMGGRITLKAEAGGGCSFTLHLALTGGGPRPERQGVTSR